MNLDLNDLRFRAASKMSTCRGHHEIHRSDNGREVWTTCDGNELNRLMLPDIEGDLSDDIRFFIHATMAEHDQDVASGVIIELLNRIERADQEHERALAEELTNRDNAHELLDQFAYAVAPMEVIGEHSSMNDPWQNALAILVDEGPLR